MTHQYLQAMFQETYQFDSSFVLQLKDFLTLINK